MIRRSRWRANGACSAGLATVVARAHVAGAVRAAARPLRLAAPLVALGAFAGIVIFRGCVDVIAHKLIPSPALYGAEEELRGAGRRRRAAATGTGDTSSGVCSGSALILRDRAGIASRCATNKSLATARSIGAITSSATGSPRPRRWPRYYGTAHLRPLLHQPGHPVRPAVLLLRSSRSRATSPGDADWGVKLDDVRGQAEAKEEITPRRLALAVRRGVREGGRQARARRALPRRRPAPARRCSPRPSPRRSTARS